MNKIAPGLAAMLLGSTAYAQSNPTANTDAGASAKPDVMLKRQGGDGKVDIGAKLQAGSKTEKANLSGSGEVGDNAKLLRRHGGQGGQGGNMGA